MGHVRDKFEDCLDGLSWLLLAVVLTAMAEEAQRQYLWPKPKADDMADAVKAAAK